MLLITVFFASWGDALFTVVNKLNEFPFDPSMGRQRELLNLLGANIILS
jgi:hypothetical protein